MLCPWRVRNKFFINFWNSTIFSCTPRIISHLCFRCSWQSTYYWLTELMEKSSN
jgi:hypothetical protein